MCNILNNTITNKKKCGRASLIINIDINNSKDVKLQINKRKRDRVFFMVKIISHFLRKQREYQETETSLSKYQRRVNKGNDWLLVPPCIHPHIYTLHLTLLVIQNIYYSISLSYNPTNYTRKQQTSSESELWFFNSIMVANKS